METKFLIHAIMIISIASALLHYNNVISEWIVYKNEQEKQIITESDQDQAYLNATKESDKILKGYETVMWCHFVLGTYLLQNLLQYIYAKLRKRSAKIIASETVLNSISFILVMYNLTLYYCYYRYIEVNDHRQLSFKIVNRMNSDWYCKFQVSFAIIYAIQWLRIFFIIRASKFLGPMIYILVNVIGHVGKFMIAVYLVLFLVFLSLGRIMFLELEEFKTTNISIMTLFSASLGEFDFSIFRGNMALEPGFGYAYMIIFLTLVNIVALNFAIAILTQRFNQLDKINNALYLRQIILIRQIFQEHETYSGMVCSFAPLNFLNLVFIGPI